MSRALVLALVVALATSCDHPQADEARDALVQFEGAQFYRTPMPTENGGPSVISASLGVRGAPGAVDLACAGELARPSTAVALGLAEDVGYWVVRATIPTISRPDAPTFSAPMRLSPSITPGKHDFVARAVDAAGHFGPPFIQPLDVKPPLEPSGQLVVSLAWQNNADLDLHVVLPTGTEIYKSNPSEYVRPPAASGPITLNPQIDGGALDRDANAKCVRDGQRREDVVWTEAPPKGHYLVRVDLFALCGEPSAPWVLSATLFGNRVAAAQGTGTENDLRFAHDRGAGVLALEFDIP